MQKRQSSRRPFTGAWIETNLPPPPLPHPIVAPSRGRGLKLNTPPHPTSPGSGRPFTGAWIETYTSLMCLRESGVAPSRGRGLKLECLRFYPQGNCRPFTGAWIETPTSHAEQRFRERRPFTGAWIETKIFENIRLGELVAPSRGRGLKHRAANGLAL